jgi:putative transcriptional regulator
MSSDTPTLNLTNHFLIAMPGLNDDWFGKSVVFMCEHTPKGALGLVINKPSDITLGDLFNKLDLPLRRDDLAAMPVLRGGPLQLERGFVLHSAMGQATSVGSDETPPAVAQALRDALDMSESNPLAPADDEPSDDAPHSQPASPLAYASTVRVGDALEMTTSRDVLEAVSSGAGPSQVLVTLGYASWGEGQLESEMGENSWLSVQADPALLFNTPIDQRYDKAMALLGLQSWMLAPGSGHA